MPLLRLFHGGALFFIPILWLRCIKVAVVKPRGWRGVGRVVSCRQRVVRHWQALYARLLADGREPLTKSDAVRRLDPAR